MARIGMVIDLDECLGCHSCTVACDQENQVPIGHSYGHVHTVGPIGEYPNLSMYYRPQMCQHCEDPPCVKACPTGASYRREDGLVLYDASKCVGVQTCVPACPYGVRKYDPVARIIEKCWFCAHKLDAGDRPACIKSCVAECRTIGDLDDPDSEVSRLLREAGAENVHTLKDTGNRPKVFYILHEKTAKWQPE